MGVEIRVEGQKLRTEPGKRREIITGRAEQSFFFFFLFSVLKLAVNHLVMGDSPSHNSVFTWKTAIAFDSLLLSRMNNAKLFSVQKSLFQQWFKPVVTKCLFISKLINVTVEQSVGEHSDREVKLINARECLDYYCL